MQKCSLLGFYPNLNVLLTHRSPACRIQEQKPHADLRGEKETDDEAVDDEHFLISKVFACSVPPVGRFKMNL